jgi:fatty-acid desaturase
MIVLGLILLLIGAVTGIGLLWAVGGVLVIVGAILWILGAAGHQVGRRAHYF